MDIEVLHTPEGAAIEGGLAIDADRHELQPDGEWVRWAKGITGRPKLFVYRHRETGAFMLCEWVLSPAETTHPTCVELFSMEGPPDQVSGGRPSETMLRARCRGAAHEYEQYQREAREARRAERVDREDRHAQKMEHVKRLRDKGMHLEALQQENDPHWEPPRPGEIEAFKKAMQGPRIMVTV